jgi:hypothetical protein
LKRPPYLPVSEKLVTIRNFAYSLDPVSEAHLARLRLESENIPCFLSGEHSVGTYWFSSVVGLGVKLQVRQSDADRARAVLELVKSRPPEKPDDVGQLDAAMPKCPRCGSGRVEYHRYSRPLLYISLLLLHLPLSYPKRSYRCESCGHRWKHVAPDDTAVDGVADPGGSDAGQ